MGRVILPLSAIFLAASLIARTAVLVHLSSPLQFIVLAAVFATVFVICRPAYQGHLFFLLACSLPFFGMPSYHPQNIVFEFFLSLASIVLVIEAFSTGPLRQRLNVLQLLLGGFGLLALLSLLLMPVGQTIHLLSLWGLFDFAEAMLQSTPGSALYPFAAVGRLLLFLLFGYLLASSSSADRLFVSFFRGLAVGVFLASCFGLLEHYHLLSLEWLRPATAERNRLQSLFGNPGWFAEFVVVCIPFVFVLVEQTRKRWWPVWAALIVVAFIAVILTGSRTAWLLYPLVVAVGWVGYSCGKKTARDCDCGKTFLFVVKIGGGIMVFVMMAATFTFLQHQLRGSDEGLLQQRLARLTNVGMRKNIWQDALALGREEPFLGRGYESYKYQALTLVQVPESRLSRQHEKVGFVADTPHNLYLQIFVSNGIVGLAIWCMLVFSLLLLLYHDFRINGRFTSFAVLCSVVVFHLYGLTQSMQYIGVVWLLIFLAASYAMAISPRVLPSWGRRVEIFLAWGSGILVCISCIGYAVNYQSRLLAERYGLHVYGPDQDSARFAGFFPVEQWGKRSYRWTGRRAVIRCDRPGLMAIDFFSNAPRMATNPVVLDVFLDGSPIDRVTFWQTGTVTRKYAMVPDGDPENSLLELRISRTWNPRQEGISGDSRNLGVAVSGPRPDTSESGEDLGFYGWQLGSRGTDSGHGNVLPFRWSHWQALLHERRTGKEWPVLQVKSERPFLAQRPLAVIFLQADKQVASIHLADTDWNKVEFSRSPVAGLPLVIRVQQTWNPRREGYGGDPRDLGVAVASARSAGNVSEEKRSGKDTRDTETSDR
ncbi:O-antigen ligase family protein [Thermodesulfobacteriota bacterium B35]